MQNCSKILIQKSLLKLLISILFVLVFFTDSFSQEVVDVIYLKNGTVLKGKIIERTPNVSVTIKTLAGNTYLVKKIAIEKIRRETLEIPFDKSSRFLFFLSGGFSVPAGEPGFRENNFSGYNFNLAGAYELNRDMAIRIDLQYNDFPPEIGESRFKLLAAKSEILIYSLKELPINPYAFGGIGVYFLNMPSEFKPKLGAGFGVGLNFRLSENKLYLYGEAQFNYIYHGGVEKMYLPGRIGIMLTNKIFSP